MRKSFIFLTFFIGCPAYAGILEGVARNQKGEIVYLEKHNIEKDADGFNKLIRVEYSKPDGTLFANMFSDFSKHKTIPETEFEDTRFKSKFLVRVDKDQVEFEEFKNDKSLAKKNFPIKDTMVVSQGFDNFIRANTTEFASSQIEFKFGIIASQDFFSLTGYQATRTTDEIEYRIKASNWLIRLFASELQVVYDAKSMQLKSFSGRSNILDDSGNSQNVTIRYQWKEKS